MKMRFDVGGAVPTHPDFDMLRAGLAAAQAATPTALASLRTRPLLDRAEALVRLFGEDRADDRTALCGCFHPIALSETIAPVKMTVPFTLAFEASFNGSGLDEDRRGSMPVGASARVK
ncbi:hypothetical protein [Sphingomonas nostoxanthinifaciens]|uniref:hypothetical protein n=1 Tax=Sphingomonas nostoxanthinifaciens TaxID=2872652 RepID=UPI001CC1CCB4|nr:hypothetical protein [Sphingomonas nostoxanthinifaciens]UAK24874.1 hypothetical protein K8P63_01240 [Sphingomonas nostoxanthinifaciens]